MAHLWDIRRSIPALFLTVLTLAAVMEPPDASAPDRGVTHTQLRRAGISFASDSFADQTATPNRSSAEGRAVAHRAGGRQGVSPMYSESAPRPVIHGVGMGAVEPTIGVSEDGAIFYKATTLGFLGLRPHVLRSTDGGKSWQDVSPRHPVTLDPYMSVDRGTSRIFATDLTLGTCSTVSFSDDEGENWFTSQALCHHTDYQKVFAGPPAASSPIGYPNVVYLCSHTAGATGSAAAGTACSKSIDGGMTFVPTGGLPFVRVEGSNLCFGGAEPGVVSKDGVVYLPGFQCWLPYLAISKDEGLTWERVPIVKDEINTGSLAIDNAGNLYYGYVRVEDSLPYLTTSKDGGKSWSQPIMVAHPKVKEAYQVTVDVRKTGRIAIAYMGSENSDGKTYGAETTWNGYLTISVDGLANDPVFYSASVNPIWDPLAVGRCGPIMCGPNYDFIDVMIGPDGQPWAPFVDGCVPDSCEVVTGRSDGIVGVIGTLAGGPRL